MYTDTAEINTRYQINRIPITWQLICITTIRLGWNDLSMNGPLHFMVITYSMVRLGGAYQSVSLKTDSLTIDDWLG